MKYLKRINQFLNEDKSQDILDDLSNIFGGFEDDGWSCSSGQQKIVIGRNDWTGNMRSTNLRNVWGGEFIDYHNKVIMAHSKHSDIKDVFSVSVSKMSYLEELTEETIIEHWKQLDVEVVNKINTILSRSNYIGLKLYGVHAKWYQLGKASHEDYLGKPYYGQEMILDIYTFAFELGTINESLNHEELFWTIDVDELVLKIFGSRSLVGNEPTGRYGEEEEDQFVRNNWLNFTPDEISKIGQVVHHPDYQNHFLNGLVEVVTNTSSVTGEEDHSLPKTIVITIPNLMKYEIFKTNEDEWFYIETDPQSYKCLPIDFIYQCDQFDGLLECLKHCLDLLKETIKVKTI